MTNAHSNTGNEESPSDRTIGLEGAPNCRDLGGYVALDGRRVKNRRLYRSDHLGGVTDADMAIVASLGIRNILDFRSHGERDAFPCRVAGVPNISLAIQTDTARRLQDLIAAGHELDAQKGREVMCEVYRKYIRTHTNAFRAFFAQLLAHDGPHLFHCTAGKDRTGTAAAMLLTALGVKWDVIVQDYLLTNSHWKLKEHQATGMPAEVRKVLGVADELYLTAAFQVIEAECGGWAAYSRNQLGLGESEHARLQAWYLAD